MGTLGIHQNIPASDTKLMPSLCINFITHPLVMDILIPVNFRVITSPPKLNLLLEVDMVTASVTIKPRLIFVMHADNLRWNKTFN